MNYQTLSFLGFIFIVVLVALLTVNAVFDAVFLVLSEGITKDETGIANQFFGGFAKGYDKISLDLWSRE